MVKLTIVPVIPLALSEAIKTAMLAISSSVMPAGLTLWPLDRAPEALRGWRDYVAAAVGQLCQLASFLTDFEAAPAESGRKPEHIRSRAVMRPPSSAQNRCCSMTFQGSPGLFTRSR
jgi:hypothetical protein